MRTEPFEHQRLDGGGRFAASQTPASRVGSGPYHAPIPTGSQAHSSMGLLTIYFGKLRRT